MRFPIPSLALALLPAIDAAQTTISLHPAPGPEIDAYGRAIDTLELAGGPALLVGAPWADSGGGQSGSAYVIDVLTGAVLQSFHGAGAEELGRALAAIGDVDGDGLPELALGAPGGVDSPGKVVVASTNGAVLYTLTGLQAGEHLGRVVAALGDVNGDGAGDFLAGSYEIDGVRVYDGATGAVLHQTTGDGFRNAQAVGDLDGDGAGDYAFAYQPALPRVEAISGATGAHLLGWRPSDLQVSTFSDFGSLLGTTCATGAGDADADGVPDLAVGLPGVNLTGIDEGRVSVYSGATRALLWSAFGAQQGQQFGFLVAGVGDVDLDGLADVAEMCNFLPFDVEGLSGADGSNLFTLAPKSASGSVGVSGFTSSMVGGLDVNGDGRPELALGDAALGLARVVSTVTLPLSSTRDVTYLQPQPLTLDAGPAHAGETYLVLGTTSGTQPGVTSGGLTLPLNVDAYTLYSATHPGVAPLLGTLGTLDANGRATASIEYHEALAGQMLHHAFFTLTPAGPTFVSNALPLLPYAP